MKNLTLASITELFPGASTRKYAKGQIIGYQGDKPQHIFFVASGHLRYYDIDEHGNEKVLHLIGPNNIFPMLYAFGVTDEISAFYATLDTAELVAIPLLDFRKVTETNIVFANSLIHWFLTEINQLVYRISSLEKTDSQSKILHALKYLALDYGRENGDWQRLNFPITQQFVADFTGLARETVSATMHDLEKENIIKSHRAHGLDIKRSELEKIT